MDIKSKNKRILGIDFGSKRVGIAVSDESRAFALPVSVLENSSVLLEEVSKIARDYDAKEIVMGESKDYKGNNNEIMADIMDFKDMLEERGFVVNLEPEFMTSMQAERLQGKNEKSDASAAALILQSFLDSIKNI